MEPRRPCRPNPLTTTMFVVSRYLYRSASVRIAWGPRKSIRPVDWHCRRVVAKRGL